MSNPKKVYIDINSTSGITGEWFANKKRIYPDDLEYRLVDPSEQSKVDDLVGALEYFARFSCGDDSCDCNNCKARRLIDRISKEQG